MRIGIRSCCDLALGIELEIIKAIVRRMTADKIAGRGFTFIACTSWRGDTGISPVLR